jgi:hypothetical protein
MTMSARSVGITVLPEFFQNEGVEQVLDNITRRAGATAIATSPYVMRPVAEGDGSREPPIDAGAGSVRILDRPLWGKRDLWVRTSPSYAPDRTLYAGLRYQPAETDEYTAREGDVVARALNSAKARGLQTHLQVQAAIPPGYRVQFGGPVDEDRPRLPDGSSPALRVDNNGSLASPHILAYTQALIRDVVRAYPEIDVLRLDWPEYPPYSLDSLFFDFSPHARAAMVAMGHDPDRLTAAAASLRARITTGLTARDLAAVDAGSTAEDHMRWLHSDPAVRDWLNAKATIVTSFLSACAVTLRIASGGRIALMPQSFPPPWTRLSGFDTTAVAKLGVTAIGVKLYTMHWPMMARAYADAILSANPALQPGDDLGPAIMRAFGLDSEPSRWRPLVSVHYPEPHEAHPVSDAIQFAKIRMAQAQAGAVPVVAFAHSYGPVADFERRVRVAFEAAQGRVFVNRYGYMSDAKLDALGRVTAFIRGSAG